MATPQAIPSSNPNDQIRDAILRQLYERHRKAKSPKSAGVGIRELQAALRPLGYKQQDVARNLDYLIQKGWAVEQVQPRSFTTAGGTMQMSEKRSYKISDTGIDKLELASVYKRPSDLEQRINVTTINGVTVVGDGNVVNTSFAELARVLDDLRAEVLQADAVSDPDKLDLAADFEALQSQLQKPRPNKTVVRTLWTGIERSGAASEFAELVQRAAELIRGLL